jgi:hypothetical protein
MNVVINVMLGGELLSWYLSDIDLAEIYASHHHHSVTCHVSTIQKDARFSHYDLPGYPDRLHSNHCNTGQVHVSG